MTLMERDSEMKVAEQVAAILAEFIADPKGAVVDAQAISAARASLALSAADDALASLAGDARAAYNLSLEQKPDVANTQLRALCLALISSGTEPLRDAEKASHAKHYARLGLQFVLTSEPDEADRALDVASRLLSQTIDSDSIEVLELELLIKGYRAHASWCRNDLRSVLRVRVVLPPGLDAV